MGVAEFPVGHDSHNMRREQAAEVFVVIKGINDLMRLRCVN
jgi:hypothetical protein